MYNLIPTPHFARQFKKLDKFTQKKIKSYLENILDNPRSRGKMLQANRSGQWRYRIGDYRVIVNIQDERLIILALEIGHRREIYKAWKMSFLNRNLKTIFNRIWNNYSLNIVFLLSILSSVSYICLKLHRIPVFVAKPSFRDALYTVKLSLIQILKYAHKFYQQLLKELIFHP